MADKYLIHGATYCGDGTASTEATSNGGVGAWNTIAYFEGTTPAYGTLAAGDTVYIRGKDAAGANITRQVNAAHVYLGSANATTSAWIRWIIDNGAVWSGVDGVIKYETTNYYVLLRDYNEYIANTQDALTIKSIQAASPYVANFYGRSKGLKVDSSSSKANYGYDAAGIVFLHGTHENLHAITPANTTCDAMLRFMAYQNPALINPDIEISASTFTPVFGAMGESYHSGAIGTVIGGRVRGSISSGTYLAHLPGPNGGQLNLKTVGLQVPSTMPLAPTPVRGSTLEAIGMDGAHGSVYLDALGLITSRAENSPPTLDAVLPDAVATPWSWLIRPTDPRLNDPLTKPFVLSYAGTEAVVDVITEFLITQGFALNKANCWVDVFYLDATSGTQKVASSRVLAGGALDTSSAAWSTTSWAGIAFDKRKITVRTPTAVAQGSQIIVVMYIAYKSQTTNDVLFVDPAIKVVVV